MQVLKRLFFVAIFSGSLSAVSAQSDAEIQKAFSNSYAAEYKLNYEGAIGALTNIYNANSYMANLRMGWLNYMTKNYTASMNYYQKAMDLKPNSVEAKLGYVKPAAALESWDKVLTQYEAVLKIDDKNTTANYWAGMIYYNRKKYEPAARYFEKLVSLYPFDYDANHMLGWTYLNLGKYAEAKACFNVALMNRPGDASSLDGLSRVK